MSTHVPGLVACGVGLLLMAAPPPAASASRAEIDRARGECRAHKLKVLALEARSPNDSKLPAARLDWEHACVRAEVLMNGGEPPPAPVPEPAAALGG